LFFLVKLNLMKNIYIDKLCNDNSPATSSDLFLVIRDGDPPGGGSRAALIRPADYICRSTKGR
jgi:hypothetical protein